MSDDIFVPDRTPAALYRTKPEPFYTAYVCPKCSTPWKWHANELRAAYQAALAAGRRSIRAGVDL